MTLTDTLAKTMVPAWAALVADLIGSRSGGRTMPDLSDLRHCCHPPARLQSPHERRGEGPANARSGRPLYEGPDVTNEPIAQRCGFGEPDALRRAFLRRFGVTPRGYRSRFHSIHPLRTDSASGKQ